MKKVILTLISLAIVILSSAQIFTLPNDFGKFSKEEIELKSCPFEPDADAVVLRDNAWAFHYRYNDYVTHRTRIKILTKPGIKYGDISLDFHSKSGFYGIDTIHAITFNNDPDSSKAIIPLEDSLIFQQRTGGTTTVKFAMPQVKVGSIIEIEYIEELRSMYYLEDWSFQTSVPTLFSSFILSPPIGMEISYSIYKDADYKVTSKFIPDTGSYFEMKNIPSLKIEPYMDSPKDYLQRVVFQVAKNGKKSFTSWGELTKLFLRDLELKRQMKKNLHHMRELRSLLNHVDDKEQKIRIIYKYIKQNMVWNGRDGILPAQELSDAWEDKKGNTAELNLILINLLKDENIEVYPLLLAERTYGKLDTTFPYLDQFNKLIAFAITDNRQFILDATEEYGSVDLVPYEYLNTKAFLLDLKKYQFITIASTAKSYNSNIVINGSINNEGNFEGTANITSTEYAKQRRSYRIRKNIDDFKKKFFNADTYTFEIDSFKTENLDDDTLPLKISAWLKNKYELNGGFYLFNYNLFTNLESNPFIKPKRVSNINFGYPDHIILELNLKLPPNAGIDNPPNNISITDQALTMRCSRIYSIKDQVVNIRIEFVRTVSMVKSEDYNDLKDFYKDVTTILNEPLLIKVPAN